MKGEMVRLKSKAYYGFREGSAKRSSLAIMLISVLLVCSSLPSYSQTTFSTAQSGLWGQGTTWIGGIVPGPADNAVIQTGHSVTLNTGGMGTFINDIFIQTGSLVDQGALKMTINGNFVIDGSITSNGPNLDFFGDTLAGTGSITIGAVNKSLFISADVEILSGTQIKVDGNIILNKDVHVSNFGDLSVTGNITGKNGTTSIWTNKEGSLVEAGGGFMIKGILNASSLGNTVRYVSGSLQEITTTWNSTYYNLTIAGSDTVRQLDDLTIINTLLITTGVFDCGNHDLYLEGDWVNNAVFNEGIGTVNFNGSADQ
jgi:hypothetical protein